MRFRWLLLPALALGPAMQGCSSEQTAATSAGGAGDSGGSGGVGGAHAGGGGQGSGGSTILPPSEICGDGLDNDSSGAVDDGCTCVPSASQQCYPAAVDPPQGCKWGKQSCDANAVWGACAGATMPPLGEMTCCTVLDGPPVHALLDAFLAAYPASAMPQSVAEVQAFAPVADGHAMAWSDLNVGNELVDDANGGVVAANILAGRAVSRAQAENAMPAGSTIVWVREDSPTIDPGSACDPLEGATPGGVGWAWGSIVYQAPDKSVAELVYLYIGFCEGGDVEAFFYSDEPVLICKAPIVR